MHISFSQCNHHLLGLRYPSTKGRNHFSYTDNAKKSTCGYRKQLPSCLQLKSPVRQLTAKHLDIN